MLSMKTDLQTVVWRMDLLTVVLAELARSLPAAEAARAAEAIARGVDCLLADRPLHDSVDEAVAVDLASVLGALRRQ